MSEVQQAEEKTSLIRGELAEDVYFSRTISRLSGKIPPTHIAASFSRESYGHPKSLGFHKLWYYGGDWMNIIKLSVGDK
jgi:hypothetical protein